MGGSFSCRGWSGAAAEPSGEQGRAEQGGDDKESPEAELADEAGDALFFDEDIGDPADGGRDDDEEEQGSGQRHGAAAAGGGFLVLEDAEGGKDHAARAMRYRAVTRSLSAPERSGDVLDCTGPPDVESRIGGWSGGGHTASEGGAEADSTQGRSAARPR